MEYAVWRACERLGIKPPSVKDGWDDCDIETQSMILAYCDGREIEESKQFELMVIGARSRMI